MSKRSKKIENLQAPLFTYMTDFFAKEHDILKRLREETSYLKLGGMEVTPLQGQFLHVLTKLLNPQLVLEIGTFTGYSTLWIAEALQGDATILSCDSRPEWSIIGKKYWQEAGVNERIVSLFGLAEDSLAYIAESDYSGNFDFAFIDADKENYPFYYEMCVGLIRPGGVICLDNVLWDGKVIDEDIHTPSTIGIREVNRNVANDTRVDACILPFADGMTLVVKK